MSEPPRKVLLTDSPLPHIRFDTATIGAQEGTRAWQEISRPLFNVAPLPNHGELSGLIDSYLLGDWMVGTIQCSAHRYWRDTLRQGEEGLNHYFIQLYRKGKLEGWCNGRQVRALPGDLVFIDLHQQLDLHATDMECISLVIPRREIHRRGRNNELHGQVMGQNDLFNQLLASHMGNLLALLPNMTEQQGERVQSTIRAMLTACESPAEPSSPQQQTNHLRQRLQGYIERNLASADLGPAKLQAAFHISRSTLYRIFGSTGVSDYIRQRRLHEALHDLRDYPERPIGAIAAHWGFSNERSFQRAFRGRYGMSPSQARQQADKLLQAHSSVASIQQTLAHFMTASRDGPEDG